MERITEEEETLIAIGILIGVRCVKHRMPASLIASCQQNFASGLIDLEQIQLADEFLALKGKIKNVILEARQDIAEWELRHKHAADC